MDLPQQLPLDYRNPVTFGPREPYSRLAIASLLLGLLSVITMVAWMDPIFWPLARVHAPEALTVPSLGVAVGMTSLFYVIDSGLVRGVGLVMWGLLLSVLTSFIAWTVYLT